MVPHLTTALTGPLLELEQTVPAMRDEAVACDEGSCFIARRFAAR